MVGRALQLYRDAVAAGATPAEAAVHLADHLQYIEGLLINEAEARVQAVTAYQDERRAVAETEQLKAKLSAQARPPHVCTCPVTSGPKEVHLEVRRTRNLFSFAVCDEALADLRAGNETAWSYISHALRELVKRPVEG
jgi:hypothetical protein